MGTQQILLIVLSVIIVGIAVAVGITMFNQQAVNSNRDATLADMNNIATQVMAWYRTPASHGGRGTVDPALATHATALQTWVGLQTGLTGSNHFATGNGQYVITAMDGTSMVIQAQGSEASVKTSLQLTWASGAIDSKLDHTAF